MTRNEAHCYVVDNSSFVIFLGDGREVIINISDRAIDVGRRKPGEEYPTFQMTDWREYNVANS